MLAKYTDIVNRVIDHLWKEANQYRPTDPSYDGERAAVALEMVAELRELLKEVQSAAKKKIDYQVAGALGNRMPDPEKLPESVLRQLGITPLSEDEKQIVGIINKLGGVAHVREVLAFRYSEYHVEDDREALGRRMYNMHKKGLIKCIAGHKGFYTTNLNLTSEETDKIFNQ